MTKRQKEDTPPFIINEWDCKTKDDYSIHVSYQCHTAINNKKKYDAFVKLHDTHSGHPLFLLHNKQISKAITYVLKHYQFSMISSHQGHIERQIKNCLNENYLQETDLLSDRGLEVKLFEFTKIIQNMG